MPLTSAANSNAESPTPTAVFRPSSATAMPTNPICEALMSLVAMWNCQPRMSSAPGKAREHAGDRHREEVVARDVDPPVAGCLGIESHRLDAVAERRPVEDDPVDDQSGDGDEDPDRQALEIGIAPEDRQLGTVGDGLRVGIADCSAFCSGPPIPKRNCPTQIAIQLSMIVVITSCAPTVAFRNPAIPAHAAPAIIATTIATTTWTNGFSPDMDEPIQTAKNEPTRYCPWPPMLNMPQRKANATARPVRINGS